MGGFTRRSRPRAGVTAEEAKTAAVDAYGERITLVGKMNQISEEIKEREQQLIRLRTYQNAKPFHDHYMSLKGRKQKNMPTDLMPSCIGIKNRSALE